MENKLFLDGVEVNYEIIYRNVKNPRLELKTGKLLIISPKNFHEHDKLIKKHKKWVLSNLKLVDYFSSDDLVLDRDLNSLHVLVKNYLDFFSEKYNVRYNNLTFRKMKVRWGSCDNLGNINFNSQMKYLPEAIIKYVVFHEFSHLDELSHNKRFKNLIAREFPDYKKLDDILSGYWFAIQKYEKAFI